MLSIPFFSRSMTLLMFHLLIGNAGTDTLNDRKVGQQIYRPGNVPLKNMFGINAYEWNFLQDPKHPNDRGGIYEANMAVIRSFSAIRHYLSWNKLEYSQGNYTYNPTHDGGWDYDLIYTRCKRDGIIVLADIKDCPNWLLDTYPTRLRDVENVPALSGADRRKPSSYIEQARVAFQFAARYGYTAARDKQLIRIDTKPRWADDPPNQLKTGLGLIRYIECENERDKWWKSEATKQSPEEYAANMSAFYDGDQGKLGPGVGVKKADPSMQVVMGGLATADVKFVKRMVRWCVENRGYKQDGSIDLCFDVINYHLYNNDGNLANTQASTGIAPELSTAGTIADQFVNYAQSLKQQPEVWVTETGYDINPQSIQRAVAIDGKPALVTQADWILRSSLLYMRHGIKRLFFYQLQDDHAGGTLQYATSGLSEDARRRPAADYILQTSKLMGNFKYQATINADPIVDRYRSGSKLMYVLTIPDQKGRVAYHTLDLGRARTARIFTLAAGSDTMLCTTVPTIKGKLKVKVTETPIFVEVIN